MKKLALRAFLVLSVMASVGSSALADVGISVGGTFGYGTTTVMQRYLNNVTGVNGADTIAGFAVGANASYKLNSMILVGASYTSFGQAFSLPGFPTTTQEERVQFYLGHLDIKPFGSLLGLYGGPFLGLGSYNGNVTITTAGVQNDPAESYFVTGLRVGYDFGLLLGLTVGPEVRAVYVPSNASKSTFFGNINVKFSF